MHIMGYEMEIYDIYSSDHRTRSTMAALDIMDLWIYIGNTPRSSFNKTSAAKRIYIYGLSSPKIDLYLKDPLPSFIKTSKGAGVVISPFIPTIKPR